MMTWAFVPLMPKEETPARRGRPARGHGTGSVSRRTPPLSQSTCELGASTWRVLGSRPCSIALTILMIPPIPAADCVCPVFDLSEPSHNGFPARPWP
ncbi:hypothetical protein AN221_21285 [Streptomyces nanshensis]|uniref:Uncharacterized protein n=1 Tax=Streptomyces nanshensis TaxID=518642 RepID=A0A1E7LQZ4_9ACTN|nr:hypothetical protein AN221_21285 [Streptomyces nanshensis]